MSANFTGLMLVSSTVFLGYLTMLIRVMAQHFWMVVAEASRSAHQPIVDTTPGPTSFAIRYYWMFPVLLVLIAGVAGAICRWRPASVMKSVLLGLSLQGLVVWAAMVCYFYDYFLDEMHSYRGPKFDPAQFLTFDAGAFPLTFITLCTVMFLTLRHSGANKHLQATPR